jgi:hypothetical protein
MKKEMTRIALPNVHVSGLLNEIGFAAWRVTRKRANARIPIEVNMKRVSLLSLLLLLVSLPIAAQTAAPVIASVQPSAGPTTGGTLVTITGANLGLPPNFSCILPCPAVVRFGSSEVPVSEESNTSLTVRTPAHAAGTVDVTVRTGDGRTATVGNAFTYITDRESGYTTFLLPIYTDGDVPGAHGSLWRTEFWIRNNGTNVTSLAPWDCPVGTVCPAVVPLTRPLQPNENVKGLPVFFRPPSGNPGRLLFVANEGARDVSTSLRLWDVSRESNDAGTEIPVVTETKLLTTTAHLTSVPLNGRFRLMLRIYDVANSEARFRVRIYHQEVGVHSPAPVNDLVLTATTNDPGPFRVQPAYVQYSGIEDILNLPIPQPDQLRIEVEPLTQGSIFWTFVAVTNNETQRVTLVTPQ